MTTSTPDADLRRAFAFLAPYWRRLVLVMAISLVSTGLSLVTPYLSKDLVDRALVGRDLDRARGASSGSSPRSAWPATC